MKNLKKNVIYQSFTEDGINIEEAQYEKFSRIFEKSREIIPLYSINKEDFILLMEKVAVHQKVDIEKFKKYVNDKIYFEQI